MPRDQKFLLQAANVAEGSQLEIKHGSVLVRGGKTIGSGFNSDRSRIGGTNMVALHSEVCLTNAAIMQRTICVIPQTRHGQVASLHDANPWVL